MSAPMSTGQEMSVPPPSWVGGSAARPAPAAFTAVAPPGTHRAQAPADAAIRWRIGAAFLDNIVVIGLYLLVCLLLHWRVVTIHYLPAILVIDVLYHLVLESRDGQTLGKRRYGLRVVTLDGQVPAPKAILLRSVLRIVDQLPAWYASGLINVVRTGPNRRQRIGDVVAGTTVIAAEGRSAQRGTPGWYLPAATLAATAISILGLYGVTQAGNQPLDPTQTAEFVTGCDRTAVRAVDCECVLTRLQAAGYNTLNQIRDLEVRVQSERAAGQLGTATTTLRAAFIPCRR
jgi:uncharacterized RDD family membrane protein YckC